MSSPGAQGGAGNRCPLTIEEILETQHFRNDEDRFTGRFDFGRIDRLDIMELSRVVDLTHQTGLVAADPQKARAEDFIGYTPLGYGNGGIVIAGITLEPVYEAEFRTEQLPNNLTIKRPRKKKLWYHGTTPNRSLVVSAWTDGFQIGDPTIYQAIALPRIEPISYSRRGNRIVHNVPDELRIMQEELELSSAQSAITLGMQLHQAVVGEWLHRIHGAQAPYMNFEESYQKGKNGRRNTTMRTWISPTPEIDNRKHAAGALVSSTRPLREKISAVAIARAVSVISGEELLGDDVIPLVCDYHNRSLDAPRKYAA